MKTLIESLDATTKKSIQLYVENIESTSRSSSKLLEIGVDENTLVISRTNAVELIKKIPFIVGHQTIFRKLKVRPLLDPYEVVHFEERKNWPQDIEMYLKQFKANPHDTTLIFQIAIEMSTPLKKVSGNSGKFSLTGTLINDPSLYRTIALATRDVWGYNTFSGLFFDIKITDRMLALDTAFNLQHHKSILPVRVFSDFVEIEDARQVLVAIDEAEATGSAPILHGITRKLEDLHQDSTERIDQIAGKYPCLAADDWEHEEFGKILLNYYTKSPSDMIEMLGPNVICCPFILPKKFREVFATCLCQDIYSDRFGLHPLIC
jgi:hypothetical protein